MSWAPAARPDTPDVLAVMGRQPGYEHTPADYLWARLGVDDQTRRGWFPRIWRSGARRVFWAYELRRGGPVITHLHEAGLGWPAAVTLFGEDLIRQGIRLGRRRWLSLPFYRTNTGTQYPSSIRDRADAVSLLFTLVAYRRVTVPGQPELDAAIAEFDLGRSTQWPAELEDAP